MMSVTKRVTQNGNSRLHSECRGYGENGGHSEHKRHSSGDRGGGKGAGMRREESGRAAGRMSAGIAGVNVVTTQKILQQ